MALTRSKPASIFTPEGNSLAVFIDVADGTLKLKDVFGGVELFTNFVGGGGLKLKDDALMTTTLTEVADKDNTPSVLRLSTQDVTNYGGGAITTNTAFGSDALINNTTGSFNTSFGINALLTNTQGAGNVALGSSALQSNLSGASNVGVGTNALNSNSTGNFNTVVGTQSAIGITTGSNNVVLGAFAIPTLNGLNNVVIGYNTGQGITTGFNNTIIGANISGLSSTLNNNVIIADGSGNQRVVVDENGNVGLNNGTSTTQATSVIRSLGTNSGIALVPNGTGAITAQIPDGTAAGGNARGQYAVDLQTNRGNQIEVASGISAVALGEFNEASGSYSTVTGGRSNQSTGSYSVISGGSSNDSTNDWSSVCGGRLNNATSPYSTVSGGSSNTASTDSHATVVGGQSNVASGLHATVIGGNLVNATGSKSVAGGRSSTASGQASFAMGFFANAQGSASQAIGEEVISRLAFSSAMGYQVESYLYGQKTYGNGALVNSASSQHSVVLARKLATLDSAATTVLSLDGTGTTNLIIPYQSNRIWNVKVSTVAVVSGIVGTATGVTVGDSFMENRNLLFKKISNISSIVGVGTAEIISDTSMATAFMAYTAGASQELALTFNGATFAGGGSVTVRVVSKVELVEVSY